MLCYRGMGEIERRRARGTVLPAVKADESAQSLTEKPRLLSPEDNNERQPIHDHVTDYTAALSLLAVWPCRRAPAADTPAVPVRFTDITAAAGIHFTQNAGRTGKKWLPETMGSGVRVLRCRWRRQPGILLINGSDLVPEGRRTTAELYRNNGNGTFTDITRRQRSGRGNVRHGRGRRRLR